MLVATLALLAASSVRTVEDFNSRLANFHLHYNTFMRTLYGCPPGAREVEECNPKLGRFDSKEWNKTRQAARKLFE
jgi:hypothetical protein